MTFLLVVGTQAGRISPLVQGSPRLWWVRKPLAVTNKCFVAGTPSPVFFSLLLTCVCHREQQT